jgi:cellulose biosynthesis protein BcsQ
MRLLTWLDVRRRICQKTQYGSNLPTGITRINCFSDALEIGIDSDERSIAEATLKEWFGEWYQTEDSIIQLDLGNSFLPVELLMEKIPLDRSTHIRPFWEEIAYIEGSSNFLHLPTPFDSTPLLIAFYSFKGGVGRTMHLAAHVFALLDCAKELEKEIKILVIDADLEAPGLTYWDRQEQQQPAVSFIDFMEAYHYSQLSTEETLELFAAEVKKSAKREGKSVFYFLPACLADEQLLDTPILPEHLTRGSEGEWTCGNAIHKLGRKLEADYVLIDLRAGLSEISSPLIFDPRIERFFVTTATEQSVAGLSLVLKQISRVAPSEEDVDEGKYFDPSAIVSFLTPQLKSLPAFEDTLVRFRNSYAQSNDSEESSIYAKRLEINETDFAQELLYINSWQEARSQIASTSIAGIAKRWAEDRLKEDLDDGIVSDNSSEFNSDSSSLEEVTKFKNVCEQYVFAESGGGEKLLVTTALNNLATNFRDRLPNVVSVGAKGSGKTFIYIQLSRLQTWDRFVNTAIGEQSEMDAYIFPFLQSRNLQNSAKTNVDNARSKILKHLTEKDYEFRYSEYVDRIKEALEQKSTELEWTHLWMREIARSIGIESTNEEIVDLKTIDTFLKQKQTKIVFLLDGLEDIFQEIASNENQKTALKALINLPDRLSEIRQASLGLIVLLRRDFLRHAIVQNVEQFESRYRSYDLYWDADSFIKLVYWVCTQAGVIGAKEEKLNNLGREKLLTELEKLWGEKLGGLREARTANWVFAALTDFKGRLQARDVVRFLFHAADITTAQPREVQFEKWSSDRLLPPQAIRRALDPCSEKKVQEATEEYPDFKEWIDKIEERYPDANNRSVPFTSEELDLDRSTIKMLEDMGVIYEDRDKDDITRYYMPEIFRAGLKFKLESGKRPRVLVLKRKSVGIGIL